jgi:hypothetical protein
MVYRKGELSPAGVDRGWPYQVALKADLMQLFSRVAGQVSPRNYKSKRRPHRPHG